MKKEELHEMHEHAEHAKHNPSLVPVTFTMALLAVFVAAVSLLGHRTHTHELLLQNKATNQWAYFQAKNIRRHSYETFVDLLSVTETKDPQLVAKLKEKYKGEVERYRNEQKEIEAEARHLEQEGDIARRAANRFGRGAARWRRLGGGAGGRPPWPRIPARRCDGRVCGARRPPPGPPPARRDR